MGVSETREWDVTQHRRCQHGVSARACADPEDQHYLDAQAHAKVQVAGFLSLVLHNWSEGEDLDLHEIRVDVIENARLVENDIGQVLHG